MLDTAAEIFWGQAAASHGRSSRGGLPTEPELRIQPLSTISHPLGQEDVRNPLYLPVWSACPGCKAWMHFFPGTCPGDAASSIMNSMCPVASELHIRCDGAHRLHAPHPRWPPVWVARQLLEWQLEFHPSPQLPCLPSNLR